MSDVLDSITWPAHRVGEALEALATFAGYAPREVEVPPLSDELIERIVREGSGAADAWIEQAAAWLGVEAEGVDTAWSEVTGLLANAAPAILVLPATGSAPPRVVLLLGRTRRLLRRGAAARVLGVDLMVREVDVELLRSALCGAMEKPYRETIRAWLTSARVPPQRFERAEATLLAERLGAMRIPGCWLLRMDPGDALSRQLRRAGVQGRLARMLALQLGLYALAGVGWYILGRGALGGTLDRSWLLGWGLALLTTIPLQLMAAWQGGFLALEAGALFKQRLLAGAVRLDPEVVRHQGAGGLLGRVIESSAVEASALSGATLSIAALPALLISVIVLATGIGGVAHAALYAAWVAFGVLVALRYGSARRDWTIARVAMTNDLVERMVGHRTRIAQEAPERWHEGEDKAVERYVAASESLDRTQALLTVIVPRGWTLLGIAALAPSLVSSAVTPTMLALGVGSVVLAGSALRSVTAGLVNLLAAGIAWREVAPLFHAATKRDVQGAPLFALGRETSENAAQGATVVEAHDIVFRHEGRAEPVLRGVSLRVCGGDRILLEGPSGGGKSTLGAVIAGLRTPASGLLLLHGLDARSTGVNAWRRRVVTAPQFHENHVMTNTMAFNLLLGRRWPPNEADLAEAELICRELDLGPLLERMPSGLQQMVGESGWKLSHGEQSRLYMARALLQGAEVVVLDESFAALDPETLRKAMECALRRCPALIVIAHP